MAKLYKQLKGEDAVRHGEDFVLIDELEVPEGGFDFDALYELLDCDTVERIQLSDGRTMWVDENGKFKAENLPNPRATDILVLFDARGRGGWIVGSALVCEPGEVNEG